MPREPPVTSATLPASPLSLLPAISFPPYYRAAEFYGGTPCDTNALLRCGPYLKGIGANGTAAPSLLRGGRGGWKPYGGCRDQAVHRAILAQPADARPGA